MTISKELAWIYQKNQDDGVVCDEKSEQYQALELRTEDF